MPTGCPARSWSSRCRCSTSSRRPSSGPSRTGRAPPRLTSGRCRPTTLLQEAYREAARRAREEGLVALIVPDELAEPALADVDAYEGVPLLTPRQAKGLEFDHVIVVEPALIAEREQGLRHLYVSLTRPTKSLVVLHARPLPDALTA